MHALVIGGDSVIGRRLAERLLGRGWEVTVTSRQRGSLRLPGMRRIEMDLQHVAGAGTVDIPDNDVTFLCAAMTGFAECDSRPEISELVNVEANLVVANEVVERGGRTVFVSTSAVFDGRTALRPATDTPDGDTTYGRQKARAERLLRQVDERLAVVRFAKVLDPAHGLIRGWIDDLGKGRAITPFDDLITAPVSLESAVGLLCAVAAAAEEGIFQFSAARDITYADIACHIAKRLCVSPRLVVPGSALAAGHSPQAVPVHATLDSHRSLMLLDAPPIEPLRVIDQVFGLTEAFAQ